MLYNPPRSPDKASRRLSGGTRKSSNDPAISNWRIFRYATRSNRANRFTRKPAANRSESLSLNDRIVVTPFVINVKCYYRRSFQYSHFTILNRTYVRNRKKTSTPMRTNQGIWRPSGAYRQPYRSRISSARPFASGIWVCAASASVRLKLLRVKRSTFVTFCTLTM